MKYEHQGVTITFYPDKGTFGATVKNEQKEFGSLSAAKKAIDAARTNSFPQFKAFAYLRVEHVNSSTEPGIREFAVVDLKTIKPRSRYSSPEHFFIDGSGNEHRHVLNATPEVRDIIKRAGEINTKAYEDKCAIEKAQNEAIRALRTELEKHTVGAGKFKLEMGK